MNARRYPRPLRRNGAASTALPKEHEDGSCPKLPQMEDAALAVLRANAERLEQTGTSAQRAAAAALMPALEAWLSRRAAKLAAAKGKRTVTKRGTKA